MNRQCNGHRKRTKGQTYSTKKTTQKTTDRAARTPLKPGVNSGIPKELAIPSPLVTLNFLDLICVYVFSSML